MDKGFEIGCGITIGIWLSGLVSMFIDEKITIAICILAGIFTIILTIIKAIGDHNK